MRNMHIQGARSFGPPKGWDAALSGECLTISVLQTVDQGAPYQTTAWEFDQVELDALVAGGHLFGSINSADVPVQRIWVQAADGTLVGDLVADRGPRMVDNAAGQRAALVAIAEALATKRGLWRKDWGKMTTPEVIASLAQMVDRVPAYNAMNGIVGLPVVRLEDVPGMPPAAAAGEVVSLHFDRPPETVDIRLQDPAIRLVGDDLPEPGGRRIRGELAQGGPVDPGTYLVGETPTGRWIGQNRESIVTGGERPFLPTGDDLEQRGFRAGYRACVDEKVEGGYFAPRHRDFEDMAWTTYSRTREQPSKREPDAVAPNDAPFQRADQCGAPDGETVEVKDPADGIVTTMVVGGTRWRNWLHDIGPGMPVRRLPKPLP